MGTDPGHEAGGANLQAVKGEHKIMKQSWFFVERRFKALDMKCMSIIICEGLTFGLQ